MALAETAEPVKKGPSLVVQMGVLVVLTLAALGAGWISGMFLDGGNPGKSAPNTASAHDPDAYDDLPGSDMVVDQLKIFRLETITTNLAAPTNIWVRMDLALVFEDDPDPDMAEIIHQDILAYLRTVKFHQIEGASGFQHLKTDIEERAAVRSKGQVKHILVRTLLFE